MSGELIASVDKWGERHREVKAKVHTVSVEQSPATLVRAADPVFLSCAKS